MIFLLYLKLYLSSIIIISHNHTMSFHNKTQINIGTLLLNMDGAEIIDNVHDFLRRLFSNNDIIPLSAQKYVLYDP